MTLISDIHTDGDVLRARKLAAFPENGQSYAIVQAERTNAVILTYDCDVDRGLENIAAGNPPAPVELVTVAAVRPVLAGFTDEQRSAVRAGKRPRFALIPATNDSPEGLVDYSSVQQISLRILVPRAMHGRVSGMGTYGQLRLLERLAHAIGDVVRRQAPAGADDPTLFRRAFEVLEPADGAG
jgi:hypothetical protein